MFVAQQMILMGLGMESDGTEVEFQIIEEDTNPATVQSGTYNIVDFKLGTKRNNKHTLWQMQHQ
ncbi:MAG: hypothetical protein R2777_01200 [Chitinophagales bacterium]